MCYKFFCNDTANTEIYKDWHTLALHDALPILQGTQPAGRGAAGGAVLTLENIRLGFGGVTAIDDVSFEVRKGEILAIIGPNGAGKSSMLNCINGFYKPRSGSITFKGRRLPAMNPHFAAANGEIGRAHV